MATFSTLLAAEIRAKAKGPAPGGDNTWLYAYHGYATGGSTPCVRVIRPTTGSLALTQSQWIEITDDATV